MEIFRRDFPANDYSELGSVPLSSAVNVTAARSVHNEVPFVDLVVRGHQQRRMHKRDQRGGGHKERAQHNDRADPPGKRRAPAWRRGGERKSLFSLAGSNMGRTSSQLGLQSLTRREVHTFLKNRDEREIARESDPVDFACERLPCVLVPCKPRFNRHVSIPAHGATGASPVRFSPAPAHNRNRNLKESIK